MSSPSFNAFYNGNFDDTEEQQLLEKIQNTHTSETDSDVEEHDTVPWINTLNESELSEVECSVHELIGEYIQNEIGTLSSPQFHEKMKTDITELIFENLKDANLCNEEHYENLEEFVGETCDTFFETNINIPPRSYKTSFVVERLSKRKHNEMVKKLQQLSSIEQPQQRTEEWYKFRHGLITASNIWKALGSESQKNSLIYEKCKPYAPDEKQSTYVNVSSPMHWGNKYEPLTIMVYEKMYNTKVSDFGCIQHPKYPFIGASPDGINTDPQSERFGRMVEVKNIFNRDITGIPKEEYWIQMQIQMETCDLDECDFIETRFKEYEAEEDFYENKSDNQRNGVVLYFVEKIVDLANVSNSPHYVYMPLDIALEKKSIDVWIKNTCDAMSVKYSLYETIYWYLDEISVVLVKRNHEWFKSKINDFQSVWDTIERERVEGYEHRTARKRPIVLHENDTTSQTIRNLPPQNNICLIKLDENGDLL
jgi:putative phage-type endonuclease